MSLLSILRWVPWCVGLWLAVSAPVLAETFTEPVWNSRVWFERHGEKSLPPLLLIHGLSPQAAHDWDGMIPRLRQRFHVITLDLPGFGRSEPGNQLYSPANYARVIDALLRHLSIPAATVMGHSMGGTIALRLAADHPPRVERLVLLNTAGVLHASVFSRFLARFGVGVVARSNADLGGVLGTLAEQLFEQVDQAPFDAAATGAWVLDRPQLRATLLGGDPLKIAALALSVEDFSADFARISAPALIVWSADDPVTPLRTGEVLAARLSDARLEVLPGAEHMLMHEFPDRLALAVTRFAEARHGRAPEPRRSASDTSATDYACRDRADVKITGGYRHISLDRCDRVLLEDVAAESLSVRDSTVTLRRTTIHALDAALSADNARLEITASQLRGATGMRLDSVELDVAGSLIEGSDNAIEARGSTRAVFSVSEARSGHQRRPLHGIELFR
ncbi:MAG: alpha/beta fold hydrolase [Thiotrichales bacterium]